MLCRLPTNSIRLIALLLTFWTLTASSVNAKGCHSDGTRVSRTVNGIKITIEPKPAEDENLSVCRASLTRRDGTDLNIGTDFDITFLPVTGKDVNGDGQPDAVLEGWSGGAHCCYTYWIVSLGDSPRVIRKIFNQDHIQFLDLNKDGKIELVTTESAFDYFDNLCFACSPFVEVILRLDGNTLSNVGSEFWQRYERVIRAKSEDLSPEVVHDFQTKGRAEFPGNWDETKSNIFLVALSYLYAGKENDALHFLISMYGQAKGVETKEILLKQAQLGFLGDPRSPDFGCHGCGKHD